MCLLTEVRSLRRLSGAIFIMAMWGLSWCAASPAPAATGQLTATWMDSTPNDHDGFKVERKTGVTGTYTQVATLGPTVISYIDAGLNAGGTYCYQVRAYNAAGDSSPTPEVCANVPIPVVYSLGVTKTGSGTVASSPTGIDCGASCSASFTGGTSIALRATPVNGYTFGGWGGACTGTEACTVILDAAKTVTATFSAIPTTYALSVSKSGAGTGTVTSIPAGINCGTTCSASLNTGTLVTLTAMPTTSSTFTGWSGACAGTGNTCTVTMDAAKSVTAAFTLKTYTLSVSATGTGSGTVSPVAVGSSGTYTAGATVTLTPTPASNSTFTGWSGACTGTGPCAITMDSSKSVSANFAVQTFTLSVNKSGTGSGSVSPVSIGSSATYAYGTTVSLTATPATGSTFTGWSGACTGTTCTVTMTSAKTVTAAFAPVPPPPTTYTLSVSMSGAGNITSTPAGIDCGTLCNAPFGVNMTVTLTAVPATGSTFTGWSGACTGTGACTVTMDAAKSVTAMFATAAPTATYTLSVTKTGNGTGKMDSSPAGLDCSTNCQAAFGANTSVKLTAIPETGSTFLGWGGACAGTGPCTLTMTQAKSVTGTFKKNPKKR